MSSLSTAGVDALVLEGLGAVLERGEAAERVIERLFRRHRGLDNDARRTAARRIFGVACLRRRLTHLVVASGGPRSVGPRELVATYAVDVERLRPDGALLGLGAECTPWLERIAREEVEWPSDPVECLATRRSLPDWLARAWIEAYGEPEADQLAEAINQPGPVTIRANLLKLGREALRERLADEGIVARPAAYSPWALQFEGRVNVFGSRAWRDGLFEVQDEGSQLIALAADAAPGQVVVDWCAGAGGKTLALAAAMQNRGRLIAADVDAKRLGDMSPRLARAGGTIVERRRHGHDEPLPSGFADVVLVDAPCSSTGVLRRGPDMRWRIDPREVEQLPALQLEILLAAAETVRRGGRLVYATCSLLKAENEAVVGAFLERAEDFLPAPLASLPASLGATDRLTLAPHRHGTDGFFIAAFERHDGDRSLAHGRTGQA